MTKVLTNATAGDGKRVADIAAQRGETEAFQIAIRPTSAVELAGVTADGLPSGVTLSWAKVAHMYCEQSEIIPLAGDAWFPDPLLPPSEF
eukprot:SAG31_NODE_11071_length_1069_cov_1.262887_1_plen_89_part_10